MVTDPYHIAPDPEPPCLPGTVVLRENADQVIDALAADMLFQALSCVRAFGDFHLALPGGDEPQALYRRLMIDPPLRRFPWTRTHLWLVRDERTETESPRYFEGVAEWLVEHSGIPCDQVHPIPVEFRDADRRYERDLTEQLEWREKGHDRLDFVLLTLDERCGVPEPPSSDDEPLIRPATQGVAMSHRLVNGARLVAVLASGASRRTQLNAMVDARARGTTPDAHSDALLELAPPGGDLRWYLDRESCPAR